MGRDLTKRYSGLFETQFPRTPFTLLHEIYKSGKLLELSSFIVWELLHKLRIFPKAKYLRFNDSEPLTLTSDRLIDSAFTETLRHIFESRALHITTSRHNWKLLFICSSHELFGCLYPNDCDLYKSVDNGQSIIFITTFTGSIKAIFVSSHHTIFVCVKGAVYKSSDNGASFKISLALGSLESFFRHNNGITEAQSKMLVIGEYGNVWSKTGWKNLANLYFSFDEGETWQKSEFLIKNGINKHIHMVKYSTLLNKLLVTDGDNKKTLWLGAVTNSFDPAKPDLTRVNKLHIQMGGYTSSAETDKKLLLGTDYQGGTNFVVESIDGMEFTKTIVPDPYRRSPIDNMVLRKSHGSEEIWANLPFSTPVTKCLLMYTTDGGKCWTRLLEWNRSTHTVWLISSSAESADGLYLSIEDSRNKDRVVYRIDND